MSSIAGGDLDRLSAAELLAVLREQERIKHEAELVELAVIAKLEARNVAFDLGAKNTVDLLRHALNIGAGDAAGRVRLAAAVCERTTLTGVPVEPAHPQTAAALAEGSISTRAAATIVRTVDAIDDFVVDDAGPLFEQNLIEFARDHDPETLGRHAHGMKHRLDQDGAYREADRAQRRHDALLEAMKLLFASGQLPTVNGCATTIVLHADLDDFGKGEGVAWTAHGVAVPTNLAKRWLEPEARALMVLLSRTKGIVAYSDKQRLFTEQQRLAMFARDQGCSYWGCDAPIAWTQAHHLRTHGLALGDDRRIPALDSAELG